MYAGRRVRAVVRAVVKVLRIEGGLIIGQSTDGHQLIVRGSQPFPLSTFIEVIGIADTNQSIRAEICTDFGEQFGRMQILLSHPSICCYVILYSRVIIGISLCIASNNDVCMHWCSPAVYILKWVLFSQMSVVMIGSANWQMANSRACLFEKVQLGQFEQYGFCRL